MKDNESFSSGSIHCVNLVASNQGNTVTLKNACIECGGDITVTYVDEMSKAFALSCDVCPTCYEKYP